MNLMGDYAAANHDVIHRQVSKLLGAEIIAGVENHHNFAWKETHGGEEVIVHRKGATPAARGRAGRDSRLDGRPGVHRARQGERRVAWTRRRTARAGRCRAPRRSEKFTWQRGAEGPGEAAASACSRPAPTKCRASTRTSST